MFVKATACAAARRRIDSVFELELWGIASRHSAAQPRRLRPFVSVSVGVGDQRELIGLFLGFAHLDEQKAAELLRDDGQGGGGGNSFLGNGGNGGQALGGALYAVPTTSVTLSGDTISSNRAQGGSGAGIDYASTAIVTLTNATIGGNTPGPGGKGGRTADPFGLPGSDALPGVGAGIAFIAYVPGGEVTIYNTICDDIFGPLDTRLAAGQQPSSNNLIGAGGSGGLVNGTRGNIVGAPDLKLGPLANDGGPTQTIALQSGSPALGKGSNPEGLLTDQRGFAPRTSGSSGTDIGAYQAGATADTFGK